MATLVAAEHNPVIHAFSGQLLERGDRQVVQRGPIAFSAGLPAADPITTGANRPRCTNGGVARWPKPAIGGERRT